MSYVTQTQHHASHGQMRGAVRSVFHSVGEFFSLIGKSAMAASDFERLNRLSDRQLNDIGLARTDLSQHVYTKNFG